MNWRGRGLSTIEDRALLAFLGLLFFLSIVIATIESIGSISIAPFWISPVLLAALYAILRLVGAVPEIGKDVRYLRDVANVRVQRMPNVSDYYDNLTLAVSKATSSLDLTHIRDTPPSDFGEQAGRFFSQLIEWCLEDGHSIRRIICVRTPAMHEWAKQLGDEIEHVNRFRVRVIDWSVQAPAMNMAIVDNEAVYLALTGSTAERTKGLGIEDEQAAQYFSDYYENLWRDGIDLRDWLTTCSRE